MQSLFKKLEINPQNCFIFIAICFCLFILICSALYPFSQDEVRLYIYSQQSLFNTIKTEMFGEAPRLLNLLVIVGIYWGAKFKVLFCILNPLIQLGIVCGLFYLVKGRKLDINKQADILPFLFMCLTCLFMIPSPATTQFCIAGTFNYSWTFALCLSVLCLYRYTYQGNVFKNAWYVNLICLFLGFAAGMSNENTGPMMLGISLCFFLYCKYKKIKIPGYVYLSFLGIILGLAVMFGCNGSLKRLHTSFLYASWLEESIFNKLFYYLPRFHDFLAAVYFVPVLVFIGLSLMAYDLKKKVFQEKFILSAFFLFCGLTTAFVLVAAPLVPGRAFYSAGMFCLISLFFFLDFFYDVYKIYILKYFTLIFLVYCLLISPFVVLPYVSLYKNFKIREAQILLSKAQGKEQVCSEVISIVPAPTQNLTIEYLDLIKHHSKGYQDTLKQWYGIEVIVPNNTL